MYRAREIKFCIFQRILNRDRGNNTVNIVLSMTNQITDTLYNSHKECFVPHKRYCIIHLIHTDEV